MRVAFSGTHCSGKTTLVQELAAHLPEYRTIEEPYLALQAEGFAFSHPPVPEDYERQLEQSVASCRSEGLVILDRSPMDFLAYLACISDEGLDSVAPWLDTVQRALSAITILVFVPIESPDRIDGSQCEFPRLRRKVDAMLRSFLVEDALGISPPVLEVSGSVNDRVAQVMARMETEP